MERGILPVTDRMQGNSVGGFRRVYVQRVVQLEYSVSSGVSRNKMHFGGCLQQLGIEIQPRVDAVVLDVNERRGV